MRKVLIVVFALLLSACSEISEGVQTAQQAVETGKQAIEVGKQAVEAGKQIAESEVAQQLKTETVNYWQKS
jgi:starvation-inducible outer membrane lipoprotein